MKTNRLKPAAKSNQHYRVLVIDDNPKIHEDFRKILCAQDAGAAALDKTEAMLFDGEVSESRPQVSFTVDSAYQGQEGLDMVRRSLVENRPYAMAFVDVRMPPGLDGINTIVHIWQKYPELQIVVCTAYSDYSWPEIVRHFGFSDNFVVLKKPFDNIEVMQLAHAMTHKWMKAREAAEAR